MAPSTWKGDELNIQPGIVEITLCGVYGPSPHTFNGGNLNATEYSDISDNSVLLTTVWGRQFPDNTPMHRGRSNKILIFRLAFTEPWPQLHPTPLGWPGTPSVSWALSPNISVGPRWFSCGRMRAKSCSQVPTSCGKLLQLHIVVWNLDVKQSHMSSIFEFFLTLFRYPHFWAIQCI